MLISHSRPILPQMMFTKAQSPMDEHMVRTPICLLNQPAISYTGCTPNQLFFLTMNEVNDDVMKWMNEHMKCHEVGELKVVNIGGMKMEKRGTPRKLKKISTLSPTIFPLATPRLELGNPVGKNERYNQFCAETARNTLIILQAIHKKQ